MKLTPAELKERLEQEQFTIEELSNLFQVGDQTIRNKLKRLKKDGEFIVHDGNGLRLLTKEDLEKDVELCILAAAWFQNWLMPMMTGLVNCAKPGILRLPLIKKMTKELMTKEERQKFIEESIKITNFISYIHAEEEDG